MAFKALMLAFLLAAGGANQLTLEQLRSSARSGDREAAFALGRAYKLGDGAPLSAKEAARWFEKAAQLGHPKAGDELGLVLYHDGRGGEAMPWLKAAAERGDTRAQYALGTLYFAGKHVPADQAAARDWMARAARSGLPAAKEALTLMARPALLQEQPAYEVVTVTPPRVRPPVNSSRSPAERVARAGWEVQLGAFSVTGNAERLWKEIRRQVRPDLRASFPKDGSLTRLRLAPFGSRAEAERFCADQRSRKRDCLEVLSKS